MEKNVDCYVAEKKMRLYSKRFAYCTLATLWKNQNIMIDFNVASNKITNISSINTVDETDIELLKSVIIKFLA